jgi:hypothetical protein
VPAVHQRSESRVFGHEEIRDDASVSNTAKEEGERRRGADGFTVSKLH